ncbi:DUF2177 family protein [Candidatus Saccharibacteria bacterium]|nr:DUF2177 family protein [Candidatus Saccharibacteria bacterium]
MGLSTFFAHFLVFGLAFGLLEAAWMAGYRRRMYQQELGGQLAQRVDVRVILLLYLVYMVGVTVFVMQPAWTIEYWPVLAMGVFFGVVTHATYNLANLAALRHWSRRVAVVDVIWGGAATGLAAYVSVMVLKGVVV